MAIVVSQLTHDQPATAAAIRRVMLEAYRVEAGLLGVRDFAPLHRTAAQIAATDAVFLGISTAGTLAAVAETERPAADHVHIASLVVLPSHFRRGLATALLRHIVAAHTADAITVSTGVRNQPALRLYASHGFGEDRSWTTRDGIPMVTLLRRAGEVPCRQRGNEGAPPRASSS